MQWSPLKDPGNVCQRRETAEHARMQLPYEMNGHSGWRTTQTSVPVNKSRPHLEKPEQTCTATTEVFALPRGCWFLYEPERIDFCISVWSNGSSSFGLEGQCLSINLYRVQHEILYHIPPWLIFNKACVGSGNQVKRSLAFCPGPIFKNYHGIGLNITLQSFTCVRFQTTNHFHTHVLF